MVPVSVPESGSGQRNSRHRRGFHRQCHQVLLLQMMHVLPAAGAHVSEHPRRRLAGAIQVLIVVARLVQIVGGIGGSQASIRAPREHTTDLVFLNILLSLCPIHADAALIFPPPSTTTAPRVSLNEGPNLGSHEIRYRRSEADSACTPRRT